MARTDTPSMADCAEESRRVAVLENEQRHTSARLDRIELQLKEISDKITKATLWFAAAALTAAGVLLKAKLGV